MNNPREAAFFAVWKYFDTGVFVADTLENWPIEGRERRLAQEIAFGTVRKKLSCEHLAAQSTPHKRLKIKKKERALLLTAVYQLAFMERLPSYAICDEAVKLATLHCHRSFPKFLNAVLRRLCDELPSIPEKDDLQSLSIRYSYPPFLIEKLLEDYDMDTTKSVLALGNKAAIPMARLRSKALPPGLERLTDNPPMATITDTSLIKSLIARDDLYIQNATPVNLLYQLAENIEEPKNILDLCASPGGKLIAASDLFPKAHLFANDVSETKIERLQENLKKYHLDATVSCSLGEEFKSDTLFDLIIIDAPCSNSGTMNKRPEARWRISQESIQEQMELQLSLLTHTKKLLSPEGQLWYMTCSILKEENENLVDKACQLLKMTPLSPPITLLPNATGWDGGFAQSLGL